MTLFLQITSLAILIIASVGWGRWVWESNRPIHSPENLSPLVVHGILESDATVLADAVAIGIIGRIAEHTRTVAFINEAAASAESAYDIRALTRVSQPAPSLIGAAKTPQSLDITVEFAGSKVETKGLLRLLQASSPKRGALSISLLIEKRNEKLVGLASSSFPSNSAYGFAVPIGGNTEEIAEQIAMRFVQAHYAAADSFYSALDPDDFRVFWQIRRRAAEIALRASGGITSGEDDPLKKEARTAYTKIDHLVHRYTKRLEFQNLGAYLASVSEDFEQAKFHLELVKKTSTDEKLQSTLEQMIAALDADAGSQLASSSVATSPRAGLTVGAGVSELERGVLAEPSLAASRVSILAEQVRNTASARVTEIALVLGAFNEFAPFKDRIMPLEDRDRDSEDKLLSHTQNVSALIASLAPKAKIRVVKALSGSGGGSRTDVMLAIERALASNPEIIVLPLGPFDSKAEQLMLERAGNQSLVLIAAGNSNKRVDTKIPDVITVGAMEGDERARYSNYGEGVDIFTPGSVLTFDSNGMLQKMNGTSFSVAIAAAAIANLAALESSRLTPAELKQLLLKNTTKSGDYSLLRITKR